LRPYLANEDHLGDMLEYSGKIFGRLRHFYLPAAAFLGTPNPRGLMATPDISNQKANLAFDCLPMLHVEFPVMHGDPRMWRL
jgi:hypothetical protein